VQFQVKEIVYSVFQWDDGQFHFEESSLPEKERITVDLDIMDLVLAGIRRIDANGRIQGRYPEGPAAGAHGTKPSPAPGVVRGPCAEAGGRGAQRARDLRARARSATTRR
jgi:hypothetical protein